MAMPLSGGRYERRTLPARRPLTLRVPDGQRTPPAAPRRTVTDQADLRGGPEKPPRRLAPVTLPGCHVVRMNYRLTAREAEVLVEIAEGHSNTEIAARLFVSEATVKTHVNHLLAKTGCRDRAALVGYAYRTGRITA
jgi:DNA-binding NarL/FixJ family response regulator